MEKMNPGPTNVREAEDYMKKLNELFHEIMKMIKEGNKDALETMIRAIKKHMQGTWVYMATAQVDITILTVKDPSCETLRESLEWQPMTTSDPDDDLPTGEEVFRKLPQAQSKAVREDCINLFKNLSMATHHISVAMANLAALAKKVDTETFRVILRASAWPLVQINIDEGTLDPTRDEPAKSNQEAHNRKLREAILPDTTNIRFNREPANSTTHLLTAAIYLKLKKYLFNKGTQTETSTKFKVKPKALGQILSGRHYLGGRDRKTTQKPQEEEKPKPQRKRKRAVISSDEDLNHHLADKSQPGEWWVAVGRGADYPVDLAKTPTTHRISS